MSAGMSRGFGSSWMPSAGSAGSAPPASSLAPGTALWPLPLRLLIASPHGQVARRIDRLALPPDLEMQLHAVGVARAHLRDFLSLAHRLVFLHQQGLVVRVRGQIRVVVLEDDQVAVAAQARACVDDTPVGGRQHGITGLAADVEALVALLVEAGEHHAGADRW